jgi:hypothetical protein
MPMAQQRPVQQEHAPTHSPARVVGAPSAAWEGRLEIIIAVALGLAAIVTAGAVFLNERQEHMAEQDFHASTHAIVLATGAGLRGPTGHELEFRAERLESSAADHQDKAATYTLAEVILATSLFLFGVAGISSRWRLKIATLIVAFGVFLAALIVLAVVEL